MSERQADETVGTRSAEATGDDPATAAPAPIALDAVPRVARPFRLQFERAQDAWVLLYPEGMVKLNGPAGAILERCDGVRDVAAIVADLERAFGREGLADDVAGFLGLARARGWVALGGDDEDPGATGAGA